jgi:RNA polymerase sigma-70 factor (ECF subfamily)
MVTDSSPGTSTERRLIVLAGGEAPSGSRVPASEFHRRWMELCARDAAEEELVGLAFDYCHRMVFSIACRITQSRWEAEDVTQTVFEGFTRALGRIRDPARIPGFLKVSVVRTAMHHVKRGRWRRERLATHFEPRADVGGREEAVFVVRELLGRLSARDRTALVLKFGEGVDYDDLARLMGLSVATARRTVAAAKQRLERIMGPRELGALLEGLGRE